MKSLILLIGLIGLCFGGCRTTEQAMFGFVSDDVPKCPTQRQAEPRPKTKNAKQLQSQRSVLLVGVAEPTLPPWSVPTQMPSRVLQSTLTPSELFAKVSPAIYSVAAEEQPPRYPASHGSAVAISSKEAITNCHVVAHAKSIILANASGTLRAKIVSADSSKDRCYLKVLEGELDPVSGIRDYTSLVVGEVVFTIGSPKGLVNTLGSGLLSGLRKSEREADYIQTTAPVSEGSSGGGLFDDRGNLIGVTTFTVRDSQNLNFAIAASEFWR
jgi:serine protease Do